MNIKAATLAILLIGSTPSITQAAHPCRGLQREYDSRKKEIARYHREIEKISRETNRMTYGAAYQNRRFNDAKFERLVRRRIQLLILTDSLSALNTQTFVRLSECYINCK